MATLRKRKRKGKNGAATYWIVDYSVTENGKTARKQEHFRVDSKEPARARLLAEQRKAEVERQLARQKLSGDPGLRTGPRDVEIADWLEGFCKATQPNCSPAYHAIVIYSCKKFRNVLRDKRILTTGRLRRQHFAEYAEGLRRKGNKPNTRRNDLAILSRAVRWGIEEGWLEPSLILSFPKVRVPKQPRRALSLKEIEELLVAAKDTDLYGPVLVALYTGARAGELIQLRCSDIDLEHGVLRLRAEVTKSATAADIPIHERIRPLLEERAKQDDWLVTRPSPDGPQQWRRAWLSRKFTALVREKLGWQDVTFHCLRHTFGTRLAASGKITAFELQRLMRHKSITTSMIYVNLANLKLPDIDVF